MKKYLITAPEGMVIDEKALKEGKIDFIPEEKQLPKKWELEEGKTYYFIDSDSNIRKEQEVPKNDERNENLLPTERLAKAMLSLCKLLVMRDRYNAGWVPDYRLNNPKYCIEVYHGHIYLDTYEETQKVLSFKDAKTRDLFYENFKEDIEIAKPLL